MVGILLLLVMGVWVVLYRPSVDEIESDLSSKLSSKLDQLWKIAQESLREKHFLRAEKALLTILRVDERNATAYNRLGILYARQKSYKDAIECFEIAQSLEPSASSLHNVGLIYFETGKYDRAAQAFEQALKLEDGHAARHTAYAKVLEKQGHIKKMLASLETAVRLEPNIQSYRILADAYDKHGREEDAAKIYRALEKAMKKRNLTRRVANPKNRAAI